MSKIHPSPIVQMENGELGQVSGRSYFFLFKRKSYVFFWYILEKYKFGLCTTVWLRGFGLNVTFLPLKESLTLFQIWTFYYTYIYFVSIGVMENRVTKVNSKYFNGILQRLEFLKVYLSARCIFIKQEAIYFNFRLDIGVYIFNHVNEFISISEITQRTKIKIPISSKDITERLFFSLLETLIM